MDYLKQLFKNIAGIIGRMTPSQVVMLLGVVAGTIVGATLMVGWLGDVNMLMDANPLEQGKDLEAPNKQTVEFRAADGSANIHYLIAGLVIASYHGLEDGNSLKMAEELYVDINIHKDKAKAEKLNQLPASCFDSALALEKKRSYFEYEGVFPSGMIDKTIKKLKSYNDKGLSQKLYGNSEETRKLVVKYIHVM